jgi:actin-like ATPase involved in cell morphogenesis
MYALGIDLGTTFTAAGVWRDGRSEVVPLGSRMAAIPSVVHVAEDGTALTGEAAERRALAEPHRAAREFKRRLGDTTPIVLGGAPFSAEQLSAKLLRAVVDAVERREGAAAEAVTVCHPANWGPYKTDLLQQAVRLADLRAPKGISLISEPEAAAVLYSTKAALAVDARVAVYDLGGGTFDAAVMRKAERGFELLGRPEGIERLGGIDFDAAVFAHVAGALEGALDDLDEDDPGAVAAVARLRDDCSRAKEALSEDTEVTIPVLLPSVSTEVRLTRAEFEAMVRPALADTVDALRRALGSAHLDAADLHSVLLVGGSSRIPLVAQLVGDALGRPVAVDTDPKLAVALGAAVWSGELLPGSSRTQAAPRPVEPARGAVAAAGAAAAVGGAASAAGRDAGPDAGSDARGAGRIPVVSHRAAAGRGRPAPGTGITPVAATPAAGHEATSGEGGPAGGRVPSSGSPRWLIPAIVAALVLAGGAAATATIMQGGRDDRETPPPPAPTTAGATGEPTVSVQPSVAVTTGPGPDAGGGQGAVDTDGDGIRDSRERELGTDPAARDTDGDRIRDGRELEIGTDPLSADTDGDGFGDGMETDAGMDPLVPDAAWTPDATAEPTPAEVPTTTSPPTTTTAPEPTAGP